MRDSEINDWELKAIAIINVNSNILWLDITMYYAKLVKALQLGYL